MLDGITFERLGIPAAVVITRVFESPVRAMAQLQGLKDYRCVLVAHPMSNMPDEEMRQEVLAALPRIVELITDQPTRGKRE